MNKVDYIFCIPGEKFSKKFLVSWTNSIIHLMKQKETFTYINHYTPMLTYTRNQMIRCFPGEVPPEKNTLPFDGKLEAKKIIFIDDDMVWKVEDLIKILKSDKDIVSGFYKMSSLNKDNKNELAAVKNGDFLLEESIKNKKELIDLDGVGFGFIAIDFNVFKTLKFPWFETFDLFDKEINMVINVTEDMFFCKKAIDAGYKIYGDPTVKLGHEKTNI